MPVGVMPKYTRSTLGIIGMCWDVSGGVLWEYTEIGVRGKLLLEHTGICGGVTEIYWSIRGGLFC